MHRHRVKFIVACVATGALALSVAEMQADALAAGNVSRLFVGRRGVTVGAVSANVLTGRLTISDLAASAGRWRVSVGRLQLSQPNGGLSFITAAAAASVDGSAVPATFPPSAAANGSAFAENVVITDGATTYRLARIDLAGTPLSNADLAALLDATKPDSVETRLRKLTAASVTISEATADGSFGATEQHWSQKQILLSNVAQGKAATGSVGASSFAVKDSDRSSTTEIGSLQLIGVDLAQTAHVFAAGRTDDGEKLLPMADAVTASAIRFIGAKDQAMTVSSIKEQGLRGRAFKSDLRTQGNRVSSAKPGDPAVDAVILDVLGSLAAKQVDIENVAVIPSTGTDAADLATFDVEKLSLNDFADRRIAEMEMSKFHLKGKQGDITLASMNIGDLTFPLSTSTAGSGADGSSGEAPRAMPTFARFAVADLRLDINVAAKGETEQRVALAVNHIDYKASGLDSGRLPTKSVASVDHATYDVPANDPSMQTMRALGYHHLDVSSNVSVDYDPKQQTMTFDRFELGGVDMGSLKLKLDLGNVSESIVSQNPQVQKAASIAVLFNDADLVVRNDGLIDKALQYRADADGRSLDDEKKTFITFVTTQLPLLAGGSPKLKPLEDALAAFIAKPKTLHVSIATKNGLGVADVGLLNDPNALLDVLDIQASAND